jgi:hypothetical protein
MGGRTIFLIVTILLLITLISGIHGAPSGGGGVVSGKDPKYNKFSSEARAAREKQKQKEKVYFNLYHSIIPSLLFPSLPFHSIPAFHSVLRVVDLIDVDLLLIDS